MKVGTCPLPVRDAARIRVVEEQFIFFSLTKEHSGNAAVFSIHAQPVPMSQLLALGTAPCRLAVLAKLQQDKTVLEILKEAATYHLARILLPGCHLYAPAAMAGSLSCFCCT